MAAATLAWPSAIRNDSDVLTLDEEHGRFVICRVCCAQYAIYGGEEPERVAMTAPFCRQAWVEHQRSVHGEAWPRREQPESGVATKTEQEPEAAEPASSSGSREVSGDLALVQSDVIEMAHATASSGLSRKRAPETVPLDEQPSATKRPQPASAPKTELYWRTLRSVYASNKRSSPACVQSSSSRASSITSTNNSASLSSSSGLSSQTLLTSIRNLTSTLMMREMETESSRQARANPIDALRSATASLAAMQRDQRRAFSRLLRLQEQNLQRLQMLMRNRRPGNRAEVSSSDPAS